MEVHYTLGKEEKALMLICHPQTKKHSAEWLRALKKVCLSTSHLCYYSNTAGYDTTKRVMISTQNIIMYGNKVVYVKITE